MLKVSNTEIVMRFIYLVFFTILLCCFYPTFLQAQAKIDSISTVVSLDDCIRYALKNQPALRQAEIDQQVNEKNIRIAESAWLPQINANGSYQHYFELPTSAYPNGNGGTTLTKVGINNSSVVSLAASQTIYNNDVALAFRAAKFSREYYRKNTAYSEIEVVSNVSKAFYNVLLSRKQLQIIDEDIARLRQSLKNAYLQYQAGTVDKIDYKQATIALNNEISTRKQTAENIIAEEAQLKQLIGFPGKKEIDPVYDSVKIEREIIADTNQVLNINNRVEYQELEAQKSLQSLNVNYYRYGFLPSVAATGSYNLAFQSNQFSQLYNQSYPNSLAGITVSIPIFQGTRRLQNLSKAKLQVERADLDLLALHTQINTEYTQALANYKSYYFDLQTLRENVELARDVYNVVFLQYREGIKAYLDLIVAQTDLRTSELNFYNALFNVLSSKIDLQRSLGNIRVNNP